MIFGLSQSLKHLLFSVSLVGFAFLPTTTSFCQVKVASDADVVIPAHPSAVLDVFSSTKGMLPPRMTTAQGNAIAAPANGLLIYNTSENCINEYMDGMWKTYCELRFSTTCNCVEYLKDNGL